MSADDESQQVLELAVRLAREAGVIQRERYETRLDIATKSAPIDLVTEVDRECEALIVSELLHAHVRIAADEFWRTRDLLPSVVVVAAGLGIASTALSSPRRPWVTWIVAVGLAVGLTSLGFRIDELRLASPFEHSRSE